MKKNKKTTLGGNDMSPKRTVVSKSGEKMPWVSNKRGTNSYYKVKCHPKMAVLSRKVPRNGRKEYTKMPQGLGVLNTPRRVSLDEPVSFNADRRISIWRRCILWINEKVLSLTERLN